MTRFAVLLCLLAFVGAVPVLPAQDAKTPVDRAAVRSPRRSFEGFIEAVLNEPVLDEAERTRRFEAYFDFETWAAEKEKTDGKPLAAEERAQLKSEWLTLFRSAEFRETYKKRNVRVLEEPAADWDNGRAELRIAMTNSATGEDEHFRVLMTLDARQLHWRWYAIPPAPVESQPAPGDTAAELKQVEAELAALQKQQAELEARCKQLEEERQVLRARLAEERGGEGDRATPRKAAQACGKAVQARDFEGFLRCHAAARRAPADRKAAQARFERDSGRIRTWTVQEIRVDANDERRATAQVEVEFAAEGNAQPEKRVLNLKLLREGDEWLLDEDP
ncbi:MAG: hypothetical protein IT463_05335 [Planctomycetes bacterium]|nr:hypothetical protein [Planctomycetota bacterium]